MTQRLPAQLPAHLPAMLWARQRTLLLSTCGGAAIALGSLMVPQAALAQAIQATPTVVQGTVTIDSMVPNQDTITVTGTNAVIDWVPQEISGTALTFLPSTGTATFQGNVGATTFAVINRILPSSNAEVVTIDGTVISRLQGAVGPVGPGGHVMFYSSTGLIIGPNANFDIGSLVLTTLAPDVASFEAFANGTGPLALDLAGVDSFSVDIDSAAQITASAEGSYVVVAAPLMSLDGTTSVNGSIAYVAGEQMTLAHSSGLFDIQIITGTSSPQPISHFGNSGGPASTSSTDHHVIYGVAVGQSDPMSLFFAGNLGFDPAVSATVENGTIVLSANYNVAGVSVLNDRTVGTVLASAEAFLTIEQATITSSVIAHSSDFASVFANGGLTSIDGNLDLYGSQEAHLTSSDGGSISITGNAAMDATVIGPAVPNPNLPSNIEGQGGAAYILNQGGTIDIDGNATLTALGIAGSDPANQAGGTGLGGEASVTTLSGGVTFGGNLVLDASGLGAPSALNLASGSGASGGLAFILSDGASSLVEVGGTLDVTATATAGNLTAPANASPIGIATGGIVHLLADNSGRITVTGDATIASDAFGATNAQPQGGLADAGETLVDALRGGTLTFTGSLAASSNATGGSGSTSGGAALAGLVEINGLSGGLIDISGPLTLFESLAIGGSSATTGGSATGGTVSLQLDESGMNTVGLTLISEALGGTGGTGNGGSGTGGLIEVGLLAGSEIAATGNIQFTSSGLGGASTGAGAGGAGASGAVNLLLDSGRIDNPLNAVQLLAQGIGGNGQTGGSAQSGNVTVTNDGGQVIGGATDITSRAVGGSNTAATATGAATAGSVQVFATLAGQYALGDTSINTSASSLLGSNPSAAGLVQIEVDGSDSAFTATSLLINANLDVAPVGGVGTTGQILVDALNQGVITVPVITLNAINASGATDTTESRLQALGGTIFNASFATITTSGDFAFDTAEVGLIIGGAGIDGLTGTINAEAKGLISVRGDATTAASVLASDIFLTSGDLEVGPGAVLSAGNLLLLSSSNTSATALLGGSTPGSGYSLLQAEFDRLRAGALIFSGTATTASSGVDVDVSTLNLNGTLVTPGFDSVSIGGNATLRISGQLTYANADVDNVLYLSANRLIIPLPSGGVSVLDGNTSLPGLSGELVVNVREFIAADSSLLTTIIANPNATGLGTLLGSNSFSGPVFIARAGAMTVAAGEYILTQNTGQPGTLSGLIVGPGGLRIRRELDFGSGTMRVITFGEQIETSGVGITNDDFFFAVDYTNSPRDSAYTVDSTLNNCFIVADSCTAPLPPGVDVPITVDDYVERPPELTGPDVTGQPGTEAAFGLEFPALMDSPPVGDPGLVTDPVTSGGDGATSEEDLDDEEQSDAQ